MNVSVKNHLFKCLIAGFLLLTGCSWWQVRPPTQPHVILISVESLNFEMASCLDDTEDREGFDDLCNEALRFTHFYTTSALSQSAIATLFTGLNATEHKVFTNGNQGLSPVFSTLAEKAIGKGYRTAFFSGGPPILAKSGLHQGFEIFDDDFLRDGRFYRPVHENLERALNSITQAPSEASFTGVFIPDLQFSYVRTFSEDGKEREKSISAQKHEVGETLKWFFGELKKRNVWDNSYIILLGLNGDASLSRKNVLWHENLFRENIHTPLFIKVPKKVKLETNSFDALVSMQDLGKLLPEIFSAKDPQAVVDFLSQWKDQAHRFIETRSDWRAWWFSMPRDRAIRTYDYLIFPQPKISIYHTLVDKSESIPLSDDQVGQESLRWQQYRNNDPYVESNPVHKDLYSFIEFLHSERRGNHSDFLNRLIPQRGSYSAKVAADKALVYRDWTYLQKYLERTPMTPSCERLFNGKPKSKDFQNCRDPLFLALLDWEKKLAAEEGLFMEKSFIRKFRAFILQKQVAYLNLFVELNWDVDVLKTVGPSPAELYLSLPTKTHLRKKIEEYKVPLSASFPQQ
jgi:arylsulfatase A-like enzyme